MRIAVIGSGYVGLVSGVCLAAKGHDVTCVDINSAVVDQLNAGNPHIYERGLEKLLQEAIRAGRFRATTELLAALNGAAIAMVAVGTPSTDGRIDLAHVRAAARAIGSYLKSSDKFLAVVVKSTVVPGTTDTVVRTELESASGKKLAQFGLGMNPEFLAEGNAVADFMEPDRIVLGYEDERTLALLDELYAPWPCDKVRVNTRTAELIKYANNALLATQVSAINEIANLATAVGNIDVMDVVRAVHLDKRWSPILNGSRVSPAILTYLVPGCGFGGSCFPKDVQALRAQGREYGLPMAMLNAVLEVNEKQPRQVVEILQGAVPELANKRCLLLGLAFKPGTDDVRESASLRIAEALLAKGAKITAHDPAAADNFKRALGAKAASITFVVDWRTALAATDIVVVATKWPEYAELPRLNVARATVFDARGMFSPGEFGGARYLSIGRRFGA